MTKKFLMQILAGMPDDVEIEIQDIDGEEFSFTNKFSFWTRGGDEPAVVTIYVEK